MLVEAIVVRKTFAREHDRLVTLYCREMGKTHAVAKSVLKAHSVQALQLDEGNLVRCELVAGRGGTPIVTGAQSVRCLSRAKSSPVRWAACQFFLQVIDTLVYDHQQDEALWQCLLAALSDLDAASDDAVLTVFRARQDDLLQALGYGRAVPHTTVSARPGRTETDDTYERIAQRRLATLDLFYELVNR